MSMIVSTKVKVRFRVGDNMAMEVVVDVFPTEANCRETAIARAAMLLARRIDYDDDASDVSLEDVEDLGVGGTGWTLYAKTPAPPRPSGGEESGR